VREKINPFLSGERKGPINSYHKPVRGKIQRPSPLHNSNHNETKQIKAGEVPRRKTQTIPNQKDRSVDQSQGLEGHFIDIGEFRNLGERGRGNKNPRRRGQQHLAS